MAKMDRHHMFFGLKRFQRNRKTPGLDVIYIIRGSARFSFSSFMLATILGEIPIMAPSWRNEPGGGLQDDEQLG